jgi:hypothetical protein
VRRLWPWVVGSAIVAAVATRVPLSAFREAVGDGPQLGLAAVEIALVLVTLCTDAVATWTALLAVKMPRPIARVMAVRGASVLLFLVNYALGQGAFGYYLHRTGAGKLRSTGAILFLLGTNVATILLITTAAWGARGVDLDTKMWWTLLGGSAAFGAYLGVIALAPRVLAEREVLAPLFDAGLRGHGLALLGRFPHIVAMTLGPWVAMRVWGIPVPFVAAAATMPVVVIATALPISPAGLGTTQAALVYFFSDYAIGATADERAAHVFAFSIVHFVYMVIASVLLGVACIPFARRVGGIPPTSEAEAEAVAADAGEATGTL